MSTCKNCIHYEVCADFYDDEIERTKPCPFFKSRSRFVELPCKVGDIVYRICPVEKGKGCSNCPWEYCECHDIGFQNDRKNSIREGKANNFAWILKRIPYFGKIYFTNREEAEQALKERKADEKNS